MEIDMSLLENLHVEVRRNRPPTAVYPDRHEIALFRDAQFPATAAAWPRVYLVNLVGGFFGVGALNDFVVPVAEAIAGGKHGNAVLIIAASDAATVDYLEGLASRHSLTFFILDSPTSPLSEARPVGPLTAAEAGALELLRRSGGQATSAMIAKAGGIGVNAMVNRLRGVADKGYVHRVSRSSREGDVFVDYRIAGDRRLVALPKIPTTHPLILPGDFEAAVRDFAARQGSVPSELLVKAWHEFVNRHGETLGNEYREAGDLLRSGDTERLGALVNRRASERAKRAAPDPD